LREEHVWHVRDLPDSSSRHPLQDAAPIVFYSDDAWICSSIAPLVVRVDPEPERGPLRERCLFLQLEPLAAKSTM